MIKVESTNGNTDKKLLEAEIDQEIEGLNAYLEAMGLAGVGTNKRDHLGMMEWAMVKTYLMGKLQGHIPN